MDTNTTQNMPNNNEPQFQAVLDELGITEISPETLKTAMLGGQLLDEAKSVLDEKQKPC